MYTDLDGFQELLGFFQSSFDPEGDHSSIPSALSASQLVLLM